MVSPHTSRPPPTPGHTAKREDGSAAVPGRGNRRLQPGGVVPYGYPLFHTHRRPQLYSG